MVFIDIEKLMIGYRKNFFGGHSEEINGVDPR